MGTGSGMERPRAAAALAALCAITLVLALVAGRDGADARVAKAAPPAELQAALEDALRDTGAPGASAAVVDDGSLVWAGAAGNRALNGDPATTETPFLTASAGKSVTAAMVLRLAEEGRLSLRDRVSRFLPDLYGAGRIRVRNLLEHSSGLPDYFGSGRIYDLVVNEPRHEWTRGELLDTVRRLRFRPGSRVAYSNTNYIALGGVIEAVTGSTIEAEFRRLVGDPLGLAHTSWLYDPALLDRGAHPYRERRGGELDDRWGAGFVPTDFVGEVWTDGGLATTAGDLARFANALVAGDLLGPAGRRALLRFRDGGWGRGVFAYRFEGDRVIGHDGLYEGFTAQHWTDPASGVTVAVLTNLESRGIDPSWAIWKRLARLAMPRR